MQISERFKFSRVSSDLDLVLCSFKCHERCPVCQKSYLIMPWGGKMVHLWDRTLLRWPSPLELVPVGAEVTDGSSSLLPEDELTKAAETQRHIQEWRGGVHRRAFAGHSQSAKQHKTGGGGARCTTDLWSKEGVELVKSVPG